jgi:dienelactone hydrolase
MTRKLYRCFLAFGALLLGQPSPERARAIVDLLLAGKYTELSGRFTPKMKEMLPEEVLRTKVGPALKAFGAVENIETPQTMAAGDNTLYSFPVRLSNMPLNVNVTLDKEGNVAGLFMQPRGGFPGASPQWQRPPYSKPDSFNEREVSFGLDGWKLPGTLTVPKSTGPHPGVVLVHGSGPHDRDESVGPNKTFRDLAEGLASRGIAVLRYDKRTRVHAARVAIDKKLTVREETVDDAVAAAQFLAAQAEMDPKRIFVLGHSQGGYLAPRIARQYGKLAGYIVLAGNTRPLEDLIVEQTDYLAPMQVSDPEKARQQIEAIRKQVDELKKLKPGVETSVTFLGIPAHYWLDLRGYDPAAEARNLGLPLLVLQGERDYQVTMTDFAGWKKTLDGRSFLTSKSYATLNHLFIPGEGKSKPADYMQPGRHVEGQVIDDIAQWVAARK